MNPDLLKMTVPGVPPGLNHYVRHYRNGGHKITPEAVRFKRDVGLLLGGRYVEGRTFEVEIVIYFGKGDKGDADGLGKVPIDGLAEGGAFRMRVHERMDGGGQHIHLKRLTDNCVTDVILRKRRDRAQPRTEITIRRTEVHV